MDFQLLWAPWRFDYVSGQTSEGERPTPDNWVPAAQQDCFLCRAAADYRDNQAADRKNLVVWREPKIIAVLNRFPYNNGHLLVAPRRHIGPLSEVEDSEHLATMSLLGKLINTYSSLINAEGFNVGLNLGEVAGAGVPGHLHWHLVPRWTGDHNFITVTGNAKVIPQSLESMWEILTTHLAAEKSI